MKIYMVGGAVRDKLLGKEPKDIDYVIVGATAEDERRMIEEGYQRVGADFPVYLHPVTNDEYAFARIERKSGVGYQGFNFETNGVTLEQDLARRDLTINSMAMDLETGEIIDPFGGQADLQAGILRHTTEAFAEDPLRVFRVAKFASRYGFSVAHATFMLMRHIVNRGEIAHLSKERIVKEMLAIVDSEHAATGIGLLDEVGALPYFYHNMHVNKWRQTWIQTKQILRCLGLDPENKLGFLVGFFADRTMSPKEFKAELQDAKLSLKMIKMAHAIKEFGWDVAMQEPEAMLHRLKALEFLQDDSTFLQSYVEACLMMAHQPQQVASRINYYKRCAAAIKAIDNEAIASQHGKDGRAIGNAIKAAQIEAIMSVEK